MERGLGLEVLFGLKWHNFFKNLPYHNDKLIQNIHDNNSNFSNKTDNTASFRHESEVYDNNSGYGNSDLPNYYWFGAGKCKI